MHGSPQPVFVRVTGYMSIDFLGLIGFVLVEMASVLFTFIEMFLALSVISTSMKPSASMILKYRRPYADLHIKYPISST